MKLPQDFLWLILLLPLVASVVIGLWTQSNRSLSSKISLGAIGLGFLMSLVLFIGFASGKLEAFERGVTWLQAGGLKVDFSLRLDGLSALMLLIVTGIGGLIQVFSMGYMHEDPGFSKFFAFLSFFSFAMLGIVLAGDFLMMFVFWELVGVASYLLIGFWYQKDSAADACKKAFLTNRMGDFGFLLGILMIWGLAGTLSVEGLKESLIKNPALLGSWGTVAGLLIFCGAVGKSAQFPLHVWLPDAMEGPTPVSALIHAATMVAAGVYMLCRVFFMLTPDALMVIAWVGGFTSLFAALIALQQDDIKRILAYSTLSQLGYMVMAVGLASPAVAMFHLTTHAFFKALLFLGAGAVIHALHHEQDIWKMGGLRKKLPITFWTFAIGTIAIAGVPPLSGFFSKEAIFKAAYDHNPFLLGVAVLVAVLTAFYMARLFTVAFLGKARSKAVDHAHEVPKVMSYPLLALAGLSVLGGFMGIEGFLGHHFAGGSGHETHHQGFAALIHSFDENPLIVLLSLVAVLIGFITAVTTYLNAKEDSMTQAEEGLSRGMKNRFYVDTFYEWLIAQTHERLSVIADFVDRWIIAGLMVRGIHGTTDLVGRALRLFQTGSISTYSFLFALGVAVVLWVMI